jgi:hypothetical protein
MQEADFDTFERAFRRLAGVFRVRLTEQQLMHLMQSYFRILNRFSLDAVVTGGRQCAETRQTFPKPTDWIAAMPRGQHSRREDVAAMSETEAREYRRAELAHYQDPPCPCAHCQEAGVTHRFLRFVPERTDDDRDCQLHDPILNRTVIAGHWAHGEELRRWYAAKDAFYGNWQRLPARMRIRLPFREPGEDDA